MIQNKKLDASESLRRKLEASLSSLSGEKEDLGMVISFTVLSRALAFSVFCFIFLCSVMQQLTDVLLDMESERSMWIAKEKAYLEAKQQLDICNDENSKLSEDLIKVPSRELFYVSIPFVQVTYLPDLIHYQSTATTISL
jgi:centromeric protein E